ncbi:MAG: DUF349 domain-containing protein, partial [Paramuribaculum sp.]|nr:DUF349 domain-containing protein [Paramuribaculum sp.]
AEIAQDTVKEETATKESLLEKLTALVQTDQDITTEEVAAIKQQFYTLHNEDIRKAKAAFIENGNASEDFIADEDATEIKFKEVLATIKDKKAEQRARIEAEQLRNLERKNAIIEEITQLSADTDNVNRHYQRVKELQTEFKETGEVPPQNTTSVWKNYQDTVERFYDQWKVNKELRDYDFKKNLGEKQLLIDEATRLIEEPDVITAFRRLQDLHDKWREIGPVAKEVREEIWATFKDASAEVNKRYQAHFEERKKKERENEDAKTAICEEIEALDFAAPSSFAEWDEMTKKILDAQERWKAIGYASKKANNTLFARFREQCDDFFKRKAEYFKRSKEDMSENLAKKIALCEEAEKLQESTDWRKTTDAIISLQEKWKTIGAVPRKNSDEVWQRFRAACNTFFANKKKSTSDVRKTEQANLKIKKAIVEKLNSLNSPENDTPREEAIKQLQELRATWQATGHVPMKNKEKLAEEYRTVVGELFDKLDVRETRARMNAFEATVEEIGDDKNRLLKERDRLARAYDQRKNELQTYENNLGFFSSSSKSGDSMLRDLERKIQRLRDELTEISGKMKVISSKLK